QIAAGRGLPVILAGEGRFRALLATDFVFLRRQLRPPVLLALVFPLAHGDLLPALRAGQSPLQYAPFFNPSHLSIQVFRAKVFRAKSFELKSFELSLST